MINRLRIDFSNRAAYHVEVNGIRQVGADPRPTPRWDFRFDTGWDTYHYITNLSFADGMMVSAN